MKRWFVLTLAIILLLSFIVSAAPSDIIGDKIGVNPADIPGDVQTAKENYLKQNWADIITKNAILGKVHFFFTNISPVFQILFGQPYSLSARLFFVILLWLYIISKVYSGLSAYEFFNKTAQLSAALGTGIILAQLKVLSFLVGSVADLIFKPENWIMRIVVIALSVVVLAIAHFMIQMWIKTIKQSKKSGLSSKNDKFVKEGTDFMDQAKAFFKGLKSGQDATDRN